MKVVKIKHVCDTCDNLEDTDVFSIRFVEGSIRFCETCMDELIEVLKNKFPNKF